MNDLKVRIVPFRRETAGWNLALEEALFLKAKEQLLREEPVQPIVRMYSFSKPSVILGYHQRISEIDFDYCRQQGIDVTMRTTGGGSVYLGRNELQYSLIQPMRYSLEQLGLINKNIQKALQDSGYYPNLEINNHHPVLRMDGKSFLFDAQRRFKNLMLHHGTTLVDQFDPELQGNALKASDSEIEDMNNGQLFLRQFQQIREKTLVRSFERTLPDGRSIVIKDFTSEELKLARILYDRFYNNPGSFSDGNKKFGICYLPSTQYDMEKYAEVGR